MHRATSDIKSSKRPGQSGTPLLVRLQPDQLAALDAWIEAQGGGISRPEAVRRIIAAATVKAS